MLKPVFAAGSALWLLLANTSIEAPRLGYVRMDNHEVWSLRGITGAYYVGEFAAGAVDEHEFNGIFGVRTSGVLAELLGQNSQVLRHAILDGSQVLQTGLSTIEEAAYVRTSAEIWRIDRDRADRFVVPEILDDNDDAGRQRRIVGLTGAGDYVELAYSSDGQITIKRVWLSTGESRIRETFVGNPEHFLFLPYGMAMWTEQGVLHLRRADGSAIQIETGADLSGLHSMGKNLFHASANDGQHFAIHLSGSPLRPQDVTMRLLRLPREVSE